MCKNNNLLKRYWFVTFVVFSTVKTLKWITCSINYWRKTKYRKQIENLLRTLKYLNGEINKKMCLFVFIFYSNFCCCCLKFVNFILIYLSCYNFILNLFWFDAFWLQITYFLYWITLILLQFIIHFICLHKK